jgi:hypothetical protein
MDPKVFVSGVYLYRISLEVYTFPVRLKCLIPLILMAVILSGCSSSGFNKDSLTETWQIKDLGPDSDEFWNAKNFDYGLEMIKKYGCEPEFNLKYSYGQDSKKQVPLWGEVEMSTYARYIDFYPTRYLYSEYLDVPSTDDWGNKVDKVLIITNAYFERLRDLHEKINLYPESVIWDVSFNYDLKEYNPYDNYITENGVLGDFEKYYAKVSSLAKSLCYTDSNPTSEQEAIAEREFTKLLEDWAQFNTWLENTHNFADEANARIERRLEIDSYYEYDDKPICEEYPTTLPDYVIVKCTNLP